MNIGELKKIIHDEVVKAMREELREILTEAVTVVEEQKSTTSSKMLDGLSDLVQEEVTAKPKSITSLLQETATGMTREEYKTFTGTGQQHVSSISTGIPDFMSRAIANAKNVLDTSNRKDLERYGI